MGRALITGASSGLGREFAWELASECNDLVLVARNVERLVELAEDIRQKAGVRVDVLPADLSTSAGVQKVANRLAAQNDPITLLINNAGGGLGQDFVSGQARVEMSGANVMVNAVLILSHAAAKAMVARGRGTIINVASITSMTVQGTYSAHKAWVKTFTEGLAADLEGTGVNATVVLPGLMHTEFHQRSHVDSSQWPDWAFVPPRIVAQAALDAARHRRVLVVPGVLYKVAYGALKVAPRALVRLFAGPKLSGRSAGIPQA
ncbi:MAG: SDR family NAD(P)-dependent oxidoreductase [Actinomycetaceae bacterium]|nr:SDR family NAD(P)-dependent oxidoreductase [Actinomycetaceae bacterium]MDY5854682.1 SDR family NAD(P)-dependent oxidoreductase [Arcanobacterium sp.]